MLESKMGLFENSSEDGKEAPNARLDRLMKKLLQTEPVELREKTLSRVAQQQSIPGDSGITAEGLPMNCR